MSMENAKALIEKAKSDKQLAANLQSGGKDEFAHAGHPCQIGDVKDALRSGLLNDADLLCVVGGDGGSTCAAASASGTLTELIALG